jgi:hypothetical protein
MRDITQEVPSLAPEGLYRLNAYVGNQSVQKVWSMDSVLFSKSGVEVGIYDSWQTWGWNFVEPSVISRSRPEDYHLSSAHPNPFNASASIDYTIPKTTEVSLRVYNIKGEQVAVLDEGRRATGSHRVVFNASDFSSGIYFYTLKTKDFIQTKKMLLVK